MHKLLDGYGYSLMLCVTPVGSECLPQHCLCRFPILSFNIHLTIVAISQLSEAKFSMYRTYALAPLTPQRKGGTRSNTNFINACYRCFSGSPLLQGVGGVDV